MKNIKTFESFLAKVGSTDNNKIEDCTIYIWNFSVYEERMDETEVWTTLLGECDPELANIISDGKILESDVRYDDGVDDEEIYSWSFKLNLTPDNFEKFKEYIKDINYMDDTNMFTSVNSKEVPFETCFVGQSVKYKGKTYAIKEFKRSLFILDNGDTMKWFDYE
jgi:hypothetical protein